MRDKIPCSVLILTLNCAESLRTCLRNLQSFGEILVHDGNSTDDTRQVAESFGARVLKQYESDEPNIRVKDFTEIRFKQRADALYDWVFYVDADEFLSDELVDELGTLISDLQPKTIVKIPRLCIIDGHVRTRGLYFPEIMPRIHHRKSGATFKGGKVVHEKYVYDSTFAVIQATHPIYVPMDSVQNLRAKDNFYIQLTSKRIREERYSWMNYFRWFLFREPLITFAIAFRMFRQFPRYFSRDSIPFDHDWRYVRYHWRLFWAVTVAMFRRDKDK